MDYEKAYKESFEAAKGLHEAGNALTKMQMEIVFPQLAESDDERIRKMCITAVNIAASADGGLLHHEAKQCLDWLEKQKEQKKSLSERFRPDFPSVADFIERVDELEKNNAMKEQKPAEWSEADERMLSRCIKSVECSKMFAETETFKEAKDKEIDWLENRLKSLRPQGSKDSLQTHWKPSEEQMKWLKDVIETVPMTCRQQGPLESLYSDLKKFSYEIH